MRFYAAHMSRITNSYLRQKEFSEAELRDAMEREFAQERASWKRVREISLNLRLNAILHFV